MTQNFVPNLFLDKYPVNYRALREDMYRAYLTRASSGELDNTPIIEETLKLRNEKAQLLGYANFAELSMASKVRAHSLQNIPQSFLTVC